MTQVENQVNQPQPVTLTGTESAHIAMLLLIASEAVRAIGMEMLDDGDLLGALQGVKLFQNIHHAISVIGARQNGQEAEFDLPEGEIITQKELNERMGKGEGITSLALPPHKTVQ
jgi:hypothetical protein